MVAQEFLGLHVPWAGGPASPDGHKLARVFERRSSVEVLLRGGGERSEQEQRKN
jgi:hypothetical protein